MVLSLWRRLVLCTMCLSGDEACGGGSNRAPALDSVQKDHLIEIQLVSLAVGTHFFRNTRGDIQLECNASPSS